MNGPVTLLVNPASGQGGGVRVAHDVAARLRARGVDPVVTVPADPADAAERAGRHIDHPAVRTHQAREVRLAATGITAYADGEFVGPLPLTVRVEPAALRVVLPAA